MTPTVAASVYAIEKYLDWLKAYAPAAAGGMTFSESGPVPAQGEVAQQMFTYTAFTADFVKDGPAGRQCGRYPEVALCPVAAWRLLEGRHEARLPGRRFLDAC